MNIFRNDDGNLRPVGFMLGLLLGLLAALLCVPIGLVFYIQGVVMLCFGKCIGVCVRGSDGMIGFGLWLFFFFW
ncbi:hypothetical protein OROGR_016840 [Orobanche gracilis]